MLLPSLLILCAILSYVGYGVFTGEDRTESGAAYASAAAPTAARFTLCGGPNDDNCVIDGDTIRLAGERVRLEDIDAPETHNARCAYEQQLGDRATRRLAELINAGPFELVSAGERDRDQYGRALRVVVRNGQSLGDTLVGEGLARTWDGARHPWCG